MVGTVPHVFQCEWFENDGRTVLALAFTLEGKRVCSLHLKTANGKHKNWSRWRTWELHRCRASSFCLLTASFHWKALEEKCVTREFTLLRGLEGPMCSEKNYKAFFVTNLGIVADRPHIKMLAGRPQYADDVVTDVFLSEAWALVPDIAGDQTYQGWHVLAARPHQNSRASAWRPNPRPENSC